MFLHSPTIGLVIERCCTAQSTQTYSYALWIVRYYQDDNIPIGFDAACNDDDDDSLAILEKWDWQL